MPELIYPLDSNKSFIEQEKVGHNRWHPDIPAAATVKPGDSFRVHRLSGVVDIPNSCATVYLRTAIFDFDVRPGPGRSRSTR